ncbi:MAG: serine/threonine protein kinase [Verrucomicrobia bacterium]|nr:serine/threonine protein kinase [Verrucomicrobiota bacterium]
MVNCGRCSTKNFIPGELPPWETVPCAKCQHPVMLPVQMRQFELRSVIASGGMGIVFRAFDLNLHREVAIKLVKREMTEDQNVMAGFYREARVGAALNHTNIIHIYTFDEYEGNPYLVMELADHGSLDSRIETEGNVPELHVLDVGIKVASALATALKKGLLHRDIKPGNILYDAEGEPKLVDFGLAGQADEAIDEEAGVWGTPYYVAPEKIKRESETFLSDMYTLGGTLYHALTGHVPFEAPTVEELVQAHVYTPLTPPNQVVAEISQATSDALVIAMAKEPAQRFQSYDDFIMSFENARSHLLIEASQGGTASGTGWWKKK